MEQENWKPEDGNPSLLSAMHEIALNDTPEKRSRLYNALLTSTLLIPVPRVPPGLSAGLQTAAEGFPVQLPIMLDRQQRRITVAFTDLEALGEWSPNSPYLGLAARVLFQSVMRTDLQQVVINPFLSNRSPVRPGGQVTRPEMELLALGQIPGKLGPGIMQFELGQNHQVNIGKPAHPPSEKIQALLKKAAAEHADIAAVYLFQMAIASGSSHCVAGVVLDGAPPMAKQESIVVSLGSCIRPELSANQSLDFMFLTGALRQQVEKIGILIFRKS